VLGQKIKKKLRAANKHPGGQKKKESVAPTQARKRKNPGMKKKTVVMVNEDFWDRGLCALWKKKK